MKLLLFFVVRVKFTERQHEGGKHFRHGLQHDVCMHCNTLRSLHARLMLLL